MLKFPYMPKFLYTIILLKILALAGIVGILVGKAPSTNFIIIIFLCLFFIWTMIATSLILFFTNKKRISCYYNPNLIYKRGLKLSFTVSILLAGLLALKIYNLLNLFTGTLFLLLLLYTILTKASNKS